MITSLHLFVWFHFVDSFPIYSSGSNSVKAFVEKRDDNGWTVEETIKENGTVHVCKAFCQGKNNNGSKFIFSVFLVTKVQVKLV